MSLDVSQRDDQGSSQRNAFTPYCANDHAYPQTKPIVSTRLVWSATAKFRGTNPTFEWEIWTLGDELPLITATRNTRDGESGSDGCVILLTLKDLDPVQTPRLLQCFMSPPRLFLCTICVSGTDAPLCRSAETWLKLSKELRADFFVSSTARHCSVEFVIPLIP